MTMCKALVHTVVVFLVVASTASQVLNPERWVSSATPPVSGDSSTSLSTSSPLPANCRMGYSAMKYYSTTTKAYQHITCYACYSFVPEHRKNDSLDIVHQSALSGGGFDVLFKVEDTTYYFEPDDAEAWSHVRAVMADDLEADKLEDCCREAVHCCREGLNDQPESGCPRTWDGWSCFPPTPRGTTVTVTCPHHAYTGYAECTLTGQTRCTDNGTWAQNDESREHTDYSTCSHRPYHLINYHWEAATHALSLLALVPAIAIILAYRQLRLQRFFLHLSLFLALLGEAVFATLDIWLIRMSEYTKDRSHLDENSVWCRMVVTARKIFGLAVWTGMLAESIYLHRLIVTVFKGGGKTWVYIVIGWVPSVVVVTVWAVSRALLENYQCWLGDDHATSVDLFLITEVPKVLILIVNTALLANMTRVLVTQLRGMHSDQSTTTRRAIKATAFLLPMFGLQFFVPLYVPPRSTSCHAMQVYFFFAMAVDGLQGLYVATVYCFINKEVQKQVRRSLQHARGRWAATDRTTNAYYDTQTNVSMLSPSTHHPPSPSAPEEIPLTTNT